MTMTSNRRRLLGVMIVVVAGALVAGLVLHLNRQKETAASIRPDGVLGTSGSTSIAIQFPWSTAGFCFGQFSVQVHETATTVTVDDVVNHGRGSNCAGIGSDGKHATVDVRLSMPLGDRPVVRSADGATLPLRSPSSG